MTTSAEAKAAALEGLDFIETEEDVKAVEAATLKIQSTFRGKKIRSKLTPTKTSEVASCETKRDQSGDKDKKEEAAVREQKQQVNKSAGQQQTSSKISSTTAPTTATKSRPAESELSKRIGEMQVNDNNNEEEQPQIPGGSQEDEAERAATKIQAGFKGYKTRKELEGKLPAGSAGGAQQAAPSGCQTDK